MNLSAVFWFAGTAFRWEMGGLVGIECIVGASGLSITVPKREKEDCERAEGIIVGGSRGMVKRELIGSSSGV